MEVLYAWEKVLPKIIAVMDLWCPGEQQHLLSQINSSYMVMGVGCSVEIVKTGQGGKNKRVLEHHFDAKNITGVCFLFCLKPYRKHLCCCCCRRISLLSC